MPIYLLFAYCEIVVFVVVVALICLDNCSMALCQSQNILTTPQCLLNLTLNVSCLAVSVLSQVVE